MPPWAVTSDFAPSLPRASRPRRSRSTWSGDVLLSCWTEDETLASLRTTTAAGSCNRPSRNSRTASSAAAPDRHPPQHESPSFKNWCQWRTLRVWKWHRANLGGGMRLPARSRTLRWILPVTPLKRRISLSRPSDFVVG